MTTRTIVQRVVALPLGIEVWSGRANESLGTKGSDVHGLAASSDAVLRRKDGYLRTRSIRIPLLWGTFHVAFQTETWFSRIAASLPEEPNVP